MADGDVTSKGEAASLAGVDLDRAALEALTPLHREAIIYTLHEEADATRGPDDGLIAEAYEALARVVAASGLVAGKCHVCGCTEEHACQIVTPNSDAGAAGPGLYGQRPCGWADDTETLCDNPTCLATAERAAVGLAAARSAADAGFAAMVPGACPQCGSVGPCQCGPARVARAAVDEVLGASGPGPFPPSFRPVGGSTHPVGESMPVAHTEDGGR